MYSRHSRSQQSLSLLTMINKPPRPPSWRDFIPDPGRSHQKKSHRETVDFSDLNHVRSSSDGEATAKQGNNTEKANTVTSNAVSNITTKTSHHKKHKKHERGRLHRTRSELSISQADLPEMQYMTINLADAHPKETMLCRGGSRQPLFDAQIYLDDNAARCEKWLAGVHASQPLTDVAFAQGSGDELEIPEENWEDLERLKSSPALTSTSSSDIDSVSVCGCGVRKEIKSGGKNRRYSDTRVPHRTREYGGRAQTLPTPGRLKKLQALQAESQRGASGKNSHDLKRSRTPGSHYQKHKDGRDNAAAPVVAPVVEESNTRKVTEIERVPFKDQAIAWQVTEIDQSLLQDSDHVDQDTLKDASIACTGTPSDIDRRVTDSTESLDAETRTKHRRASVKTEEEHQSTEPTVMVHSAGTVSTSDEQNVERQVLQQDRGDRGATPVTCAGAEEQDVNEIGQIRISLDVENK